MGFDCEKLRTFVWSGSNLSIETVCNGNGNPNGNEICPFTCNSTCPKQIDENHPSSLPSTNTKNICEDNDLATFTHSTTNNVHGFNCKKLRNVDTINNPNWQKYVCD